MPARPLYCMSRGCGYDPRVGWGSSRAASLAIVLIVGLVGTSCGGGGGGSTSSAPGRHGGEPVRLPTLGRPWGSYQEGYGQVRPDGISNGGDPTGIVSAVRWQSWGGSKAIGTGISDYVSGNQTVAAGSQEPVTVVAFNLGMCEGKLAYRAIEWYFPQHGEAFNPNQYINICTGDYVGQ
jgi:hypothetical protein